MEATAIFGKNNAVRNAVPPVGALIRVLERSPYPAGAVVVIRFEPGKETEIVRAVRRGRIESLHIVDHSPGTLPSRKKNTLAVFPSEWPDFHEFMESYYNRKPSGVLYLLDNSLAAGNYADYVLVIRA